MYPILAILVKEGKILTRDRQALAILFAMPVFFILVMSFSMEGVFEAGSRARPMEIAVINRDRGTPSGEGALPLPLLARIPEDPAVQDADLEGRPLVSIPPDAPSRRAVADLSTKILEICRDKRKG